MLLEVEKRIGELLPSPEETYRASRLTSKEGRPARSIKALPEGMGSKRSCNARAIARHPEIVERVKEEAREMAERLEPLEREAAKKRLGTRTDKHQEKVSEGSEGRAADKVAAAVGLSRPTLPDTGAGAGLR